MTLHLLRIPELNVLSMCFLPSSPPSQVPSSSSSSSSSKPPGPGPVLAILFLDSQLKPQLITRRIDFKTKEVMDEGHILASSKIHKDANKIIPITISSQPDSDEKTGTAGGAGAGVLVLGGGKCLYIPCLDQNSKALQSPKKSPLNSPIKGKTPFNRSASSKRKRNSSSRVIEDSDDDDDEGGAKGKCRVVSGELGMYEVSSYVLFPFSFFFSSFPLSFSSPCSTF